MSETSFLALRVRRVSVFWSVVILKYLFIHRWRTSSALYEKTVASWRQRWETDETSQTSVKCVNWRKTAHEPLTEWRKCELIEKVLIRTIVHETQFCLFECAASKETCYIFFNLFWDCFVVTFFPFAIPLPQRFAYLSTSNADQFSDFIACVI